MSFLVCVAAATTLVACDDVAGNEDPELSEYEEAGGAKADGSDTWHDFDSGGRDTLKRKWRTPSGEIAELWFDAPVAEHSEGVFSFTFPCEGSRGADEDMDRGHLGWFERLLSWLELWGCGNPEAFGIRVFSRRAAPELEAYIPLIEGCSFAGDEGENAMYFEWYDGDYGDGTVAETAVGCFRVKTNSESTQLWMRLVGASEPLAEPDDWILLTDADADADADG